MNPATPKTESPLSTRLRKAVFGSSPKPRQTNMNKLQSLKRASANLTRTALALWLLTNVAAASAAEEPGNAAPPSPLRFEKKRITPQYWAEGASVADLNHDGQLDIVCGGHWYVGPKFAERHEFTTPVPANKRDPYDIFVYTLEHFFSWTHDFNGDGWMDILVVGVTGRSAVWFENPGRFPDAKKHEVIHWKQHELLPGVFLETVVFDDLLGEGRPQFVCAHKQQLGYARPDPADPAKPWTFTPISPVGD